MEQPASLEQAAGYERGMAVEARFGGGEEWFKGIIKRVRSDGSVDVVPHQWNEDCKSNQITDEDIPELNIPDIGKAKKWAKRLLNNVGAMRDYSAWRVRGVRHAKPTVACAVARHVLVSVWPIAGVDCHVRRLRWLPALERQADSGSRR